MKQPQYPATSPFVPQTQRTLQVTTHWRQDSAGNAYKRSSQPW